MNILDIAIVKKLAGGGGGSGTDNYNDLSNLPKINDTTLSGNKSSSALGLQSEINSDSKLASDLVDDTNQDNKFVTSTEKNTWNAKQNAIDADHKINADYVDDSTSTNKFVTASDKETWNAKQNAIDNSHKLSSDLVDDTNHTNKFVTSTEKQTWNAKQNAIDADHKLSSSLVSFTTAEAAALASGIDSSKVGQISTNQTNILSVEDMVCATEFSSSTAYAVGDMVTYEHKLYKFINAHQGAWSASDVQNYDLTRLEQQDRNALVEVVDEGAKNIFDLHYESDFTSLSKEGLTVTLLPDGTISVTGTPTTTEGGRTFIIAQYTASYLRKFNGYYMSGSVAPSGNVTETEVVFELGGSPFTRFAVSTNGNLSSLNFPNTSDLVYFYIRIYCANTTTAVNLTFKPMIATKAKLDVSQNYAPFALPNSDLTELEAEDRAELIELVDSGAKNLWNVTLEQYKADNTDGTWNGNVYTNGFITYTVNSDLTVTAHRNGSAQTGTPRFYFSKMINKSLFGGCVLATCPKGGSSTTYFVKAEDYNSDFTNLGQDYGDGVVLKQATGSPYAIYASISAEYTGEDITFKPMVVTEAAWNVSHKHVPHRPSYDLVAALAKNGGFIDSTLGSIITNADLNSINKTTFAVYNEPANLPSGITGYCYVRTSVFDENSALQELYVIQPNPVSFFRIKLNNSWTVWVQTSNV